MMSIEKDRRVELAGLGLTEPENASIEEQFPDLNSGDPLDLFK